MALLSEPIPNIGTYQKELKGGKNKDQKILHVLYLYFGGSKNSVSI